MKIIFFTDGRILLLIITTSCRSKESCQYHFLILILWPLDGHVPPINLYSINIITSPFLPWSWPFTSIKANNWREDRWFNLFCLHLAILSLMTWMAWSWQIFRWFTCKLELSMEQRVAVKRNMIFCYELLILSRLHLFCFFSRLLFSLFLFCC